MFTQNFENNYRKYRRLLEIKYTGKQPINLGKCFLALNESHGILIWEKKEILPERKLLN